MSSTSPKLFIEIVQQLRDLIKQQNISIGGKLPSERVLSDQLEVGRSTIREALRSLELLGLIETRRGEGTFLADYRKHQLVEVLAAFILQDTKSNEDITSTRATIEKQALLDCLKLPKDAWSTWNNAIKQIPEIKCDWLIKEVLIASGNRLALKIWLLLSEYGGKPYEELMTTHEKELWIQMMEHGIEHHACEMIEVYEIWLQYCEGERKQ